MLVAELITEYMESRNLKLKDMSSLTGLSVSYLSELKTGAKVPTSKRVKDMCLDLLNISTEKLDLICEVDKLENKKLKINKKMITLNTRLIEIV